VKSLFWLSVIAAILALIGYIAGNRQPGANDATRFQRSATNVQRPNALIPNLPQIQIISLEGLPDQNLRASRFGRVLQTLNQIPIRMNCGFRWKANSGIRWKLNLGNNTFLYQLNLIPNNEGFHRLEYNLILAVGIQ